MVTDFTQLDVWNKAMDLATQIHRLTKKFPKEEIYGVTSQMRRASISVAANIAEGFGRYTYSDKKHKYVQARGEVIELMTFVHYCFRVDYLSEEERNDLLEQSKAVQMMLNALIAKMDRMQATDKTNLVAEVLH